MLRRGAEQNVITLLDDLLEFLIRTIRRNIEEGCGLNAASEDVLDVLAAELVAVSPGADGRIFLVYPGGLVLLLRKQVRDDMLLRVFDRV